ncbi:MAG: helix-turn-helix transcriptional regulator [Clostridia bacterium]|nr:helix-turn-helix transcriptional regulator [Clostridia bacterium]
MARPKHTVLEYRNYELPADFPVLALTGEQWHISPIPGKRLHIHNCLEIGLCHSSGGTLVFDDQHIHFSVGDVTCIARNVPHTTWSDQREASRWSYLFLDPDALLGPAALRSCGGLEDTGYFLTDCHLLLHADEYPWARQYVESIVEEMVRCAPGYQAIVRGLFTALLIGMLRIYSQEKSENARDPYTHVLAPALDYIHENYMLDFPQQQLPALCHLSPTHFRRLFREQIGSSPLAFLHQTRILKSCALLRSSDLSVTEIAGRVGYNSLSSYNRHFGQTMGCSPMAWRKTAGDCPRPSLLTFTGWTEAEAVPANNEAG